MIRVRIERSSDGCLRALRMTGHVSAKSGPRGANIVCAAVTGLVRSCVEAVATADGIVVDGSAPNEGNLSAEIRSIDESRRDWLQGVTDVLVCGLERMASETPGEIELTEVPSAPQAHGKEI